MGGGDPGVVDALVEDTPSMNLADVLNDCGLPLSRRTLDDYAIQVTLREMVQEQ